MKVYLDISCLCRPFDDQSQVRVREEAEAIEFIFAKFLAGEWKHVSSEIAGIENDANPDFEIRSQVLSLLPRREEIFKFEQPQFERAQDLEAMGFKSADALHLAAAEALRVDICLSCDDRMCRLAIRCADFLHVRVANPVTWLQEITDD